MAEKLKILFHSDAALVKTGFGKNSQNVLSYLYKTGKYDIVHYCCNINYSNPELKKTPWRSIGCLPDSEEEARHYIESFPAEQREGRSRLMCYGDLLIDKVIIEEKPDIYIGVQDIWGVDYAIDRDWFNKINSVIWVTLDSLPLGQNALSKAHKIKNYWTWSAFATKELHRLGFTQALTMHGPIEVSKFYRLDDEKRKTLRRKNSIPENTFVIGYVFRNQIRKSVPNLLRGYKLWKDLNPTAPAKLLLHTHFSEGWNILELASYIGVPHEDILTTYVCRECFNYKIDNFTGQDLKCHSCGHDKGLVTTFPGVGVSEPQLNEIYNLMDVYCHPFTSGGQEIPIQEAKLTELITLVTNYSCGEELCSPGSGSIPLDWEEFWEIHSGFIKATTLPKSIAEGIDKVYKTPIAKRIAWGRESRKWIIDNFSVESVGAQLESILDKFPKREYIPVDNKTKNPNAKIEETNDGVLWLKTLYKEILKMDVEDNDSGLLYWIDLLKNGANKKDVENYFRHEAQKENNKNRVLDLRELLAENGKPRYLFVIKESIGDIFCCTALFKSIKEQYPEHDLYVGCDMQYADLLNLNPYVFKVIPWNPQMDNELIMTGFGDHKGYFDVYCNAAIGTQKVLNYLTNNRLAVKLQEETCI